MQTWEFRIKAEQDTENIAWEEAHVYDTQQFLTEREAKIFALGLLTYLDAIEVRYNIKGSYQVFLAYV